MKTRIETFALIILLSFALSNKGAAQPSVAFTTMWKASSEETEFHLEQVLQNLSIPWGLAFVTNNQLLITERSGHLYLFHLLNKEITPVEHPLPVFADGQGGLLDVAIGPNREWIYFTYSKATAGGGITVLVRAKRNGKSLMNWETLLETQSASTSGRHYGSRITFDDRGYLYISIGDRGHRPNGQDLSTHAGKILRLTAEGKVPPDNPFVSTKNALPEIWSYGHRNPQGLFYDRVTQRLWSIEHGPRGGDEINLIERGGNYGWPVVSHGKEYWGPKAVGEATHKEGMVDPIKVYVPSIAPGSLLVYRGQAFPSWQGNLFAGALKLRHINRIVIENKKPVAEERLLARLDARIRDIVESPEGWLYFSSDNGGLYRIRPPLASR